MRTKWLPLKFHFATYCLYLQPHFEQDFHFNSRDLNSLQITISILYKTGDCKYYFEQSDSEYVQNDSFVVLF